MTYHSSVSIYDSNPSLLLNDFLQRCRVWYSSARVIARMCFHIVFLFSLSFLCL